VTTPARAACIIGWPVEHSRSPLIHNYWLKTYGIAGEYRREAVTPDHFGGFIQSLAVRGYAGANVTVPHKEAALGLSLPDERARAVVYALLTRGVQGITIVNRTPSRADALRDRFGDRVRVARWVELDGQLGDAALFVNTTTLGMAGQPELHADIGRLPSHAIVADLVYVPRVTPLIKTAKARGLRTADGLGMLLHQAVGGFALWFGKRPEVTPQLRALLEADLSLPAASPPE